MTGQGAGTDVDGALPIKGKGWPEMHRLGRGRGLLRIATGSFVAIALAVPAVPPPAAAGPGQLAETIGRDVVGAAARGGAVPAVTEFVERRGSRLYLNGRPFRFAGANEYYLGLDDNLLDSTGAPTYPTWEAVDSALDAAVSLGVTVVRAHTLGISVGNPRSVEPALGIWNEEAFRPIDYVVAAARARGLRLMIPLTDEWRWYHGGKSTFTGWRGYPNHPDTSHTAGTDPQQRASEAHFYTDPVVIADFKEYIRHLLTHRNVYTGLTYAEDPTIAIWETGNELWDAPVAWTDQIARFIKSLAPRQLVADGSAATGLHVARAAVTSLAVDIVGGHFYPRNLAWLQNDATVAAAHGKAYVVGEYDWHGDLQPWLDAIAANHDVAGAAVWTVLPRLAGGVPEPHGDGYAIWVPGVDAQTRAVGTALAAFARRMR